MYLRADRARTDLSQDSALGIAVPGTVAGRSLALEKWGSVRLSKLLKKPIELARSGFPVTGRFEGSAKFRWKAMNDEGKRIFGCGAKDPCVPGTRLKQRELALVLETIARQGQKGFYEGWVARKLAGGIGQAGGILSVEDLRAYNAIIRPPVLGQFMGKEVVSMPPPSAGGALVIQMLGFMERADREGTLSGGYGSAQTLHAMEHATALAFADRAEQFGDPDFFHVPLERMLSPGYLDERSRSFDPRHATLPASSGLSAPREGNQTTISR